MRPDRVIALLLFVASIVLALITGALWFEKDRQEPEIIFSSLPLVYDGNTVREDLLQGVEARDDRDGDITSRIVLEKVVISADGDSAVVYYAVSDSAGNITKATRRFDTGEIAGNQVIVP